VGFDGYPHNVLQVLNGGSKNDFLESSSSLGLILLDNNQLDVQNPLLLRGVE